MPARDDIKKILIIGSGPIIIGQACEFDYSGNQALQALREEKYEVVVHNPNPATVMTIPQEGVRIYFDPLEPEYLRDILRRERPDAALPTMGGQTALNLAMAADDAGMFTEYGVQLIGASIESIRVAEDRGLFKQKMFDIGLENPVSSLVHSVEEAELVVSKTGFPAIVRPSFTLGGRGGGIAHTKEEFTTLAANALSMSPVHTALVEESLLGYQEFEFEVMRDSKDNAVIVCSIENIDPMGVHTGDSITVAPIQTLSDEEYQALRSAAIDILRAVGVDCGGSNVQFAYHPDTKRLLVIEMNPRVSRSSALASKATGFPIARCSAKLAVGCTLNEVMNDITGKTTTFFEPALDYCAVKVPRFELQKFKVPCLGTQMRSVGESLALGRNFSEALNKALRATETGVEGLHSLDVHAATNGTTDTRAVTEDQLETMVNTLHPKRLFAMYTYLLRAAVGGQETLASEQQRLCEITHFHPWVLHHMAEIARCEYDISRHDEHSICADETLPLVQTAKRIGFTDKRIAAIIAYTHKINNDVDNGTKTTQSVQELSKKIDALRKKHGIEAVYHCVDTCAGEFKAQTPYFYGSFSGADEHEAVRDGRVDTTQKTVKSLAVLGSGPNRIGQGLEFDTCCTMAALSLRERGVHVSMINGNPETVSTDFNTSNRLYLEPLTAEDVYNITRRAGIHRVVCQLGGQTPINMARDLQNFGLEIVGTSIESMEAAEDRELFARMLDTLGIAQPAGKTVTRMDDIPAAANDVGFPVLVRPSYVLGGQSMVVVYTEHELQQFIQRSRGVLTNNTVLVDKFLENAVEYDVDAVSDGTSVYIGGVLKHIEHAGVHSGDSACVFESSVSHTPVAKQIYGAVLKIARALSIQGLMNIQFAEFDGTVYVLEVNPRASRTMPFISKTSRVDMIALASEVWMGTALRETDEFKNNILKQPQSGYSRSCGTAGELENVEHIAVGHSTEGWAVKEAVFSFDRFEDIDPALSPQMRSTGEVMGLGRTFGEAFAKASAASFCTLRTEGTVFVSVADKYKERILPSVRALYDMGFTLTGTRGTARYLNEQGISCEAINRVVDGAPHVLERMSEIDLLINILESVDERSFNDDKEIRVAAVRTRVAYLTTVPAVQAAIEGINHLRRHEITAHVVAGGCD